MNRQVLPSIETWARAKLSSFGLKASVKYLQPSQAEINTVITTEGTVEKALTGWKFWCLGACSRAFLWQLAGANALFETGASNSTTSFPGSLILLAGSCHVCIRICCRECGLSKRKFVANVNLVFSVSSSVLLSVIISFVPWIDLVSCSFSAKLCLYTMLSCCRY